MLNEGQIQGKVHYLGKVEDITPTMKKLTLVVQYLNRERLEKVPIEFINPTNVFDRVKVGSEVLITYMPGGNEHNGKFYASFKGQSLAII